MDLACCHGNRYDVISTLKVLPNNRATSFPGSFLYFEKVPWLRLVTCLCMPTEAAQRWVLNLILSTFSREVNVGLLYGRYFEKEASYLSEILPGQLLGLYLNFYEYEMLIETELCSYFTAFFFK